MGISSASFEVHLSLPSCQPLSLPQPYSCSCPTTLSCFFCCGDSPWHQYYTLMMHKMENCLERQILNKMPMNNVFPGGIASRSVVAVSIIVEEEGTGK